MVIHAETMSFEIPPYLNVESRLDETSTGLHLLLKKLYELLRPRGGITMSTRAIDPPNDFQMVCSSPLPT